jgi:peptide/nickel transport system substrate-binding protein
MTALREKASLVRMFALIAVLALVAVACSDGEGTDDTDGTDTTTADTTPDDTTDTSTGDTTETTTGDTTETTGGDGAGGDLETYTMGVFSESTTDNLWNYLDSAGSSVWNAYVLAPTSDSLYETTYPGLEVVPSLAASDLPEPTQEGDTWVVDVPLKEGIQWSDGEPITAEDFVFTWNTATEFELTANWPDVTDSQIVQGLEAVDDSTLRITFSSQPGIAVWGLGQGVHFMPVMPEHFWAPVVEEARGSDNPAQTLIAASGAEAPAAGVTVYSEKEEGSFTATVANETYHGAGDEITSGDVTYTDGPFAENFQFTFYGAQDAAVLGLANGETDFLLNPLGMQQGLREQVEGNPDLTAIVNPVNGYRFLAFNHTRAPMSDPAFRDAISVIIDKEFVANQVLQGVAFPLYVIRPEGNSPWYDEEIAGEIAETQLAGADTDTRRQEAISILEEAGYTWETPPAYDDAGTFTPGEGLIGPDGEPIPQLEMITPTASYDPLRAAFGNFISGAALELGIPIVAIPTEFSAIIDQVFATDDAGAFTLDYDMFILGYSLGTPTLPTEFGEFFGSEGGSNNTGYSNEEFDALLTEFDAAQTEEEAYDLLWEMERLIARDKPHVPLFDTGILEFYNNRISYPFTETLSGLQYINGSQGYVNAS